MAPDLGLGGGKLNQGPDLRFILRLGLVTNCHQMRKDLGRRDQAVDGVPSVLPFRPVVSLERIIFGLVAFSVADSGQYQAHLAP
jgi:hypothetical protein